MDLFGSNDPGTFPDRHNLVSFDVVKLLDSLGCGPCHFEGVNYLRLPQTEVQAQVALRHHTGSAMHLVDLSVFPRHHSDASPNGCAVALGSEQFDLDPIVLVAAIVA